MKYFLQKIWTWLKHRPLLKCPCCGGSGWQVPGPPDYESAECGLCFDHWFDCSDAGLEWTEGRVPLLEWLRNIKQSATMAITGWLTYGVRARPHWRCFLGRHKWGKWEDDWEGQSRTCWRCWHREDHFYTETRKGGR